MGRRKALNEILPLFSPSPSRPTPPPPLPPALHPSSPKRSLFVPSARRWFEADTIRGETRLLRARVSCAAVPEGGGTCHHRSSVRRRNYALALSVMSLNKDSCVTGFFLYVSKCVLSLIFLSFQRKKQHLTDNNIIWSNTDSNSFTWNGH